MEEETNNVVVAPEESEESTQDVQAVEGDSVEESAELSDETTDDDTLD